MKHVLLIIVALVLLVASSICSHRLLFGWSVALQLMSWACAGILAWECDKESSKNR